MVALSTGGIELASAQSPHSIKGLIHVIGAGYGSIFLFTMIGFGISWPFTKHSSTWGTGIISCEFWYSLLIVFILVIVSVILLAFGKWYRKRKREDVLPNEQIFGEWYYGQQRITEGAARGDYS